MTYSGEYDPWAHAAELGVHVMTGVLGGTRWGEYRHAQRVIVLRHNLSERQQRCTLAHELVHAELGEQLTGDRRLDARQEQRADRIAASRLIRWDAYVRACRAHNHLKVSVANELDVTDRLMRAYERDLSQHPSLRYRTA